MRQLAGFGFLVIALLGRISRPSADRVTNGILGLIIGLGILLLLPPPQPGPRSGTSLLLFRLYLVGRIVCGLPFMIVGAYLLYAAFSSGRGAAAEADLPITLVVLATGAGCLSAGGWLVLTSTRVWGCRAA